MASTAKRRNGRDPAAIQAELERFLSSCQEPVLVEPGEPAAPLRPGAYALHARPPGCVLEVWGESGGLVRRLVAAGPASAGRLPLKARQFGGGEIDLEILDRATSVRRLERLDGMGRFEKFLTRTLAREFPNHRLDHVSSSPDLRRSLSSSYVRGALLRGADSWALLAAPLDAPAEVCDGIVTFGLLWLEDLRNRRSARSLAGLRLVLPQGRAGVTLQRLPWLNPALARVEVLELSRSGEMRLREPHDAPPLDLALPPCRPPCRPAGWVHEQVEALAGLPGVRWRHRPDGLLSLEVGGLSFARAGVAGLTYGLESDIAASEATIGRVFSLAEDLIRLRSASAPDRNHPLYMARPEMWLAEQVRAHPSALLPSLVPSPIYSGVPSVLGRDRGILDLLGLEHGGGLVVIELKSSEDIHLPLQALDYWIRVRKLAADGTLEQQGYFRGHTLSPKPPRLILAAPALQFHPKTDGLLGLLSSEIAIERIGLGSDWRRRPRAEFRMGRGPAGAAKGA